MIRTEAGGLRAFRGLTPADSTRKELACWDLSSEFLAPSESMVSNPAICGARGTTRTILAAHLCASVPVPRQPRPAHRFCFVSLVFAPFFSQNLREDGGAARRALADVQALQARLRAAGLDDTLPSARPPSPALPPAKSSKQGARSKKNRTGTIVSSTAFLDAKSAGVASFVTSTRLSHFRRT